MATVFRPGNTAVITGGASGIGLALTKRCLAAGMTVLVADKDAEALAALPHSPDTPAPDAPPAKLIPWPMDVSQPAAWAALADKATTDLDGKVSLLALNAGISPPSSWDSPAAFRAILDVNLLGVVHGITSLLPHVQAAAAPASVVITGSKQGITNPPGNAAYNASKAAVKALAEHLSFDLARTHPGVSVHLLVPGWTYTGLSGNRAGAGRAKPDGAWWPEQVVEYLEGKMGEGAFYVLCPDNDVDVETDRKRMLWAVGDVTEGRPPLTRWREEWKDKAKEWMDKQ